MTAPHFQTFRLGTVGSTFDAARDWALANPGKLAAVVAMEQTAGRGRLGRTWHSPIGGCWLTLVWPVECVGAAGLAGLLAAEAAAGVIDMACEEAAPPQNRVQIRWPNDLLIGGAKVGGLLGETVAGRDGVDGGVTLLLGIGINVNNPIGVRVEPLRTPAVSVAEVLGRAVDLERFTEDLIGAVVGSLGLLRGDGLTTEQIDRLNCRLAYQGERVQFSGSGDDIAGVLRGIDGTGRILIEQIDGDTGGGISAHASGELSCRPLNG